MDPTPLPWQPARPKRQLSISRLQDTSLTPSYFGTRFSTANNMIFRMVWAALTTRLVSPETIPVSERTGAKEKIFSCSKCSPYSTQKHPDVHYLGLEGRIN